MPCHVPKCTEQTFMGWKPDTAPRGHQICEGHWKRHLDAQDSFDLFEAFGFERPAGVAKLVLGVKKSSDPLVLEEFPARKPSARRCRDCGDPREPGHRYCDPCGEKRKAESNRKRQQRHYERQKPNDFAHTRPRGRIIPLRPVVRLSDPLRRAYDDV